MVVFYKRRVYQEWNNKQMNSQPNWLDISAELYPRILINKLFYLQNSPTGHPVHHPALLVYDSAHRSIDVTDALLDVIARYFRFRTQYSIAVWNQDQGKFQEVADYPFKEPILLGSSYLQQEVITIRLSEIAKAEPQFKQKAYKSIKQVLQKVAQWRKLHSQSQKKITLEEAASLVGVARNTLDDYYFQIKLAQKYGYSFDNLDQPFQELRKFVKQKQAQCKKNSREPAPLPQILTKFTPK